MVASKKPCLEQADGDNSTCSSSSNNHSHSLLSFMKLASNKVKTALEKPNNFKRNINHRRFLQKQFKALVKSPDKGFTQRHFDLAKESVLQSVHYNPCENSNQIPSPPLDVCSSQLEPFQHNIQPLDVQELSYDYATSPLSLTATDYISERKHLYERRIPDTAYCSSLQELVEEEDSFLTGEELTQAIQLKDLFIPEADLTQYLSLKDDFNTFNDDTNFDFDSMVFHEFPDNCLIAF